MHISQDATNFILTNEYVVRFYPTQFAALKKELVYLWLVN